MKFLLCTILLVLSLACSSGVTNRKIANLEAEIKKEFEAKQYTVMEVKLTKQSDTTAAGYIRMTKSVPGIGEMEFTEVCSATMDPDTNRFSWRCK